MPRWSLARLLPVAALVLPLAACSTGTTDDGSGASGSSSADADAFPVTIDHAFGRPRSRRRRPGSRRSPG